MFAFSCRARTRSSIVAVVKLRDDPGVYLERFKNIPRMGIEALLTASCNLGVHLWLPKT